MSVFFIDFDMAPSVIWARDLYDQMQIQSDFRKWFPRMCQYGFVEGRDYEFVPRVRPQDEGGRTVQRYVKDYRITLEMAKQLYKFHHFHKNGCFHPCTEPNCRETDHWMQAIIELLHQHKCKSHAPPKCFYESQPPDSLVTTTQIAKEYGCGAKVFNRLLHLHGIQYRANNQWVLYAKHQDLEGGDCVVSWCLGHLAEYAAPEYYDERYKSWRFDDLPILPEEWKLLVSEDKKAHFNILRKLLRSKDFDYVVNACDAG